MPIRKAVFPVAGLGTRLLPATKSQPKEMLPVGCKPVVQYVVEEMIEQGLDKFLFVTGRKKRSIEDHFDDDPELAAHLGDGAIGEVDYAAAGVEFYYVRQRRAAGNADAVRQAREFVGDEPFAVGFGDTIIASPRVPGVVGRMMQSHVQRGAAATIAVWEVPRAETYKYGIVTPQGAATADFAIADIVEKPPVEAAPSCLAVAARYIFSPEIFAAIDEIEPGVGGELWLTDAIRVLIQRGAEVRCMRLASDEVRYDIGTPLTYYRAFADFALADREFGAAFRTYLEDTLQTRRGAGGRVAVVPQGQTKGGP